MNNHTPTPWIYDEVTTYVCTEDGIKIAKVEIQEPPEADDEPETRANGHLIAAAPELLAACLSIISAYEGERGISDSDIGTVRTAIAKAQGE